MDEILLTSEELKERSELFEYEMTQVILNLGGVFTNYDRNNSPIKNNQEFADEVLGRHLDFEPLSDVEFDAEIHDLPSASANVGYVPVSEIKPKAAFGVDKANISSANKRVYYIKNAKAEATIKFCDVPPAKVEAEYAPYTSEKPISEIEINRNLFAHHDNHYNPFTNISRKPVLRAGDKISGKLRVGHKVQYKSLSDIEKISFSEEIPPAYNSVEFLPISDIGIKNKSYTVPKSGISIEKTPITEISVNPVEKADVKEVSFQYTAFTEEPPAPAFKTPYINKGISRYIPFKETAVNPVAAADFPAVSLQYTAQLMPNTEKISLKIPSLKTALEYSVAKHTALKNIETDIPKESKIPEFSPIKAVVVKKAGYVDSGINQSFTFTTTTNPIEPLKSFTAPEIINTLSFDPIEISATGPEPRVGKTPNTWLNVKYSPIPANKTYTHPIDSVPKELTAPKDFYAMWLSL